MVEENEQSSESEVLDEKQGGSEYDIYSRGGVAKKSPALFCFGIFVVSLLIAAVCYPFADFGVFFMRCNKIAEICMAMFFIAVIFFVLCILHCIIGFFRDD